MTEIDSGIDWTVTFVRGKEYKELAIRSSTADGAAEYAKLVVEHQPQDYAGFLIHSVRKARVSGQLIKRRSRPETLRYLARNLREDKVSTEAVAISLEVLANEIEEES